MVKLGVTVALVSSFLVLLLLSACTQAAEKAVRQVPGFEEAEATAIAQIEQSGVDSLLDEEDLAGDGWEEDLSDPQDDVPPACEDLASPLFTASRAFQRQASPSGGQFFYQQLSLYGGSEQASETMRLLAERDSSCLAALETEAGATRELAELSFAELGDERVAFRLESVSDGFVGQTSLSADIVLVRQGSAIVALTYGALNGDVDTQETERLARLVLQKLENLIS